MTTLSRKKAKINKQTHNYFLQNGDENLSIPTPIELNGKPYAVLNWGKAPSNIQEITGSRIATVASYVKGESCPPSPENCRKAGKALALFHKAHPKECGIRNLTGVDTELKGFESINKQEFVNKMAARMSGDMQQANSLYKRMESAKQRAHKIWNSFIESNAKKLVIHNDFTPRNAIQASDGKFIMIDFGEACDDYQEFDVAISILNWAKDSQGKPSKEKMKEFLDGYEEISPIRPEIKERVASLIPVAAFRLAMIQTDLILKLDSQVDVPRTSLDTLDEWQKIIPKRRIPTSGGAKMPSELENGSGQRGRP